MDETRSAETVPKLQVLVDPTRLGVRHAEVVPTIWSGQSALPSAKVEAGTARHATTARALTVARRLG